MSFFATAWRAVQLGREYDRAVEMARQAYAADQPLPDVVRAFARETDGKLDDQAADVLEAGLRRGAEGAQRAAVVLGRFAGAIEDHGPAIFAASRSALAAVVEHGPAVIAAARAALDRTEGAADRMRDTANATGVVAVRIATRLEALLRPS